MTEDQVWSICMALGFSGFIVGLSIILAAGQVARSIREGQHGGH